MTTCHISMAGPWLRFGVLITSHTSLEVATLLMVSSMKNQLNGSYGEVPAVAEHINRQELLLL